MNVFTLFGSLPSHAELAACVLCGDLYSKHCATCSVSTLGYLHSIRYSYAIALSGLFELYMRGGHLNHKAKPSGLNVCLKCTMNHDSISGL